MVKIPPHVRARMLRTLLEVEVDPHLGDLHVDRQALSHGAIGLMGTIGITWGLRPDGSFWKFDLEFDVPLTPLAPEEEIPALVWGCERFPWLSELLPRRPDNAAECVLCKGVGWIIPSNVKMFNARGFICPPCSGLGWHASNWEEYASVKRRRWLAWKWPWAREE